MGLHFVRFWPIKIEPNGEPITHCNPTRFASSPFLVNPRLLQTSHLRAMAAEVGGLEETRVYEEWRGGEAGGVTVCDGLAVRFNFDGPESDKMQAHSRGGCRPTEIKPK